MNCHKVQNLISAYVDCELSGMDMLAIRQHLSDCPECMSEFESLLKVKKAFGAFNAKCPSEDLSVRICRRLDLVPKPANERLLAVLQERFIFAPSRLRLAAVGMTIFAIALMFKAGQMSTNNYTSLPLAPRIEVSTLAEQNPISLFANTAAEPSPIGTATPVRSEHHPWWLAEENNMSARTFGSPGFVLAGYTASAR